MQNKILRGLFSIAAVILMLSSCKTETVKPALSFPGTWNATYKMQSSSFADNYKLYNWTAQLTLNADGTAEAVHQPGNPIASGEVITEHFKWGILDDQTMYLHSLNWSVTEAMSYRVLEYGNNYIKMDGFDGFSQYWQLTLKK